MARPREQLLSDYCLTLTHWANRQLVALWREFDMDNVRASWIKRAAAIEQVHRATVIQALKAVDDYMFATAADAGFRYDADWTKDYPQRPSQVYWGEDSRRALNRTPVVMLSAIKDGVSSDTARMRGLNYLLGIVGTEAHEIQRNVLLQRMLAQ